MGRFLQRGTDGPSFQLGEQLIGWTPTPLTPLATKASSLGLHPSKDGCDHPAHGSLHSALLVTTRRARLVLILPVSDGLFHGLAHGRLPGFLNALFHLGYACGCL
jgi:hypothetical protein